MELEVVLIRELEWGTLLKTVLDLTMKANWR
jgi:hypothetical protein